MKKDAVVYLLARDLAPRAARSDYTVRVVDARDAREVARQLRDTNHRVRRISRDDAILLGVELPRLADAAGIRWVGRLGLLPPALHPEAQMALDAWAEAASPHDLIEAATVLAPAHRPLPAPAPRRRPQRPAVAAR